MQPRKFSSSNSDVKDVFAAARQRGNLARRQYRAASVKSAKSPGIVGHKNYSALFGIVEPRCSGCGIFILGGNTENPNLLCGECKAWQAHRIHIRQAHEALIRRRHG